MLQSCIYSCDGKADLALKKDLLLLMLKPVVTFDHFKVSLLKKTIFFKKKKLY